MAYLVIHYSLTGNTKFIASVIRETIGADELMLPLSGDCPDLNAYDTIFIGTPVWAFGVASPVRCFLKKNMIKEKNVALFCSFSLFKGGVFSSMRKMLAKNTIVGEKEFQDPLRFRSDKMASIARVWASKIVGSEI
jgi:flavodoxin